MQLGVKSSRPGSWLSGCLAVSPSEPGQLLPALHSCNWGRAKLKCTEQQPSAAGIIYSLIKHSWWTHRMWSGMQTSQSCSLEGLSLMRIEISKQEDCFHRDLCGLNREHGLGGKKPNAQLGKERWLGWHSSLLGPGVRRRILCN